MSLFSKRYCKNCRKTEAQCVCDARDLMESPLSFVMRDAPIPEWHPYFDYRKGTAPLLVDDAASASGKRLANKGTVVEAAATAGGKGRL